MVRLNCSKAVTGKGAAFETTVSEGRTRSGLRPHPVVNHADMEVEHLRICALAHAHNPGRNVDVIPSTPECY